MRSARASASTQLAGTLSSAAAPCASRRGAAPGNCARGRAQMPNSIAGAISGHGRATFLETAFAGRREDGAGGRVEQRSEVRTGSHRRDGWPRGCITREHSAVSEELGPPGGAERRLVAARRPFVSFAIDPWRRLRDSPSARAYLASLSIRRRAWRAVDARSRTETLRNERQRAESTAARAARAPQTRGERRACAQGSAHFRMALALSSFGVLGLERRVVMAGAGGAGGGGLRA